MYRTAPPQHDDGQWAILPGYGKVRSGPRGRQPRPTFEDEPYIKPEPLPEPAPPFFSTVQQQELKGISDKYNGVDQPGIYQAHLDREQSEIIKSGDNQNTIYLLPSCNGSDPRIGWSALSRKSDPLPTAAGSGRQEHGDRPTRSPPYGQRRSRSPVLSRSHFRARSPFRRTLPTANDSYPDSDGEPSSSSSPRSGLNSPISELGCQCPINTRCPAKAGQLLDCRFLVTEKRWEWVNDIEKELACVPNPEYCTFTTTPEIAKMVAFCEHVRTTPRSTPSEIRSHIRNYQAMVSWIQHMRIHNVTAETITHSQVMPHLANLLDDHNIDVRSVKVMPVILVEDLTVIFRKWRRGDYLVEPNRGMHCVTDTTTSSVRYKLNKDWECYRTAQVYGDNDLVNGQRWDTRLQMQQHGAHAPVQAGISGTVEYGAYSVVMGLHNPSSNDYYADIDKGRTIYYMGTALKDDGDGEDTNMKDSPGTSRASGKTEEDATAHTRTLMRSKETGVPIRLFRTSRSARIVSHKPRRGYRYDGLYRVVRYKLLKAKRQIYRFKMVRVPGQGPLRTI